ncbi:unnamed protein product [Rodentolepis nana]|uniref:Reverse transcriptase n=1 Tax=Rodentolepis nana TaxID=102285 RepID=A0A0R3TVQ0_RODNA|nr:unnamed protein product [Rodentolepis nana]
MEANISDATLKYYQFPGTLYLLPKYRQVASEILTGVKEGLNSNYDLIKNISEHDDPGSGHKPVIASAGSGHKPVIASIIIGCQSMTKKVLTKLSWNFKKADWPRFTNLLNNELYASPLNFRQHPKKLCNKNTNIMIRSAKKTIPRGNELAETMKALIRREFKTTWCNKLKARTKEKQWIVALSDIADWPRIEAVAEFRLRTGHDCLAKHLHRLGVYTQPTCPLCNL